MALPLNGSPKPPVAKYRFLTPVSLALCDTSDFGLEELLYIQTLIED